jgi:hypothetical protein
MAWAAIRSGSSINSLHQRDTPSLNYSTGIAEGAAFIGGGQMVCDVGEAEVSTGGAILGNSHRLAGGGCRRGSICCRVADAAREHRTGSPVNRCNQLSRRLHYLPQRSRSTSRKSRPLPPARSLSAVHFKLAGGYVAGADMVKLARSGDHRFVYSCASDSEIRPSSASDSEALARSSG